MRRVRRTRRTAKDNRPYHPADLDFRVDARIRQWAVVSAKAKELKGRADWLRDELLAYAETHGRVDPTKGHLYLDLEQEFEGPDGKSYSGVVFIKKTSRVINEERARALAEEKGLTSRIFRQETIEVLDEDELYACYQEDLISDEELDALIDTTTSYALKGR